jgi:hypothetical protein
VWKWIEKKRKNRLLKMVNFDASFKSLHGFSKLQRKIDNSKFYPQFHSKSTKNTFDGNLIFTIKNKHSLVKNYYLLNACPNSFVIYTVILTLTSTSPLKPNHNWC